jgi:hypothetical protein
MLLEIDLLIFHGTPEPFHKDVVVYASPAVVFLLTVVLTPFHLIPCCPPLFSDKGSMNGASKHPTATMLICKGQSEGCDHTLTEESLFLSDIF